MGGRRSAWWWRGALAVIALGILSVALRRSWSPMVTSKQGVLLDPITAIGTFKIPPHMKVELFAAEPRLESPISIHVDDRGSVFVSESPRYQADVPNTRSLPYIVEDDIASQTTADRLRVYEKWAHKFEGGLAYFRRHSDRLMKLVDTDDDGRADHNTVFADGFSDPLDGIASGVTTKDGVVYFGCIPSLLTLSDADDDGVSDERKILHTGYGVRIGLAAHSLHALRWGPDGKLYIAMSDRGYHIETPDGRTLHNPSGGGILRCNPDGSELEEFARGLRNPKAVAFDELGNLFVCDNGEIPGFASLYYVVEGSDGGWSSTFRHMQREHLFGAWTLDLLNHAPSPGQAAWIVPPLGPLTAGPSGMAHYPGTGFSDRYRNHFFVSDYCIDLSQSGIRSFRLEPHGAGYAIRDEQKFLWNILVTDLAFGPNGKMYVSNWDENLERAPGVGRMYTLFDPEQIKGENATSTRDLLRHGFGNLPDPRLLELLSHPDFRVRQGAHFALGARGSSALPGLKQIAHESPHLPARVHAVWAMGIAARGFPEVCGDLQSLLDDGDDELRGQAARVLGEARYREAAPRLTELLGDDNPRVRFRAAQALARIGYPPAMDAVLRIVPPTDSSDVFLRHAAVSALAAMNDLDSLLERVATSNEQQRLVILLTLRRTADPRIEQFLDAAEESLVVEAARAIHDVPIRSALPRLAAMIDRCGDPAAPPRPMALVHRVINAQVHCGSIDNARALADFAAQAKIEGAASAAVSALLGWETTQGRDLLLLGTPWPAHPRETDGLHDALRPAVATMLAAEQPTQQRNAVRLIFRYPDLGQGIDFVAWALDDAKPISVRVESLKLLAARHDPQLATTLGTAVKDSQYEVRLEAARLLVDVNRNRAIDLLCGALASESIPEKQAAIRILIDIWDQRTTTAMVPEVEQLLAGTLPPELHLDVLTFARSRRKNNLIAPLLAKYQASLNDTDPLAQFRVALQGGDARAGREIVQYHSQSMCLSCHRLDGVGGKAGPELNRVAHGQSREYLLEALVNPGAKIALGFGSQTLVLSDGRVISGAVVHEDANSLVVKTPAGEEIAMLKNDIEERTVATSPMPTMIKHLGLPEMRDVVEFLSTCQ